MPSSCCQPMLFRVALLFALISNSRQSCLNDFGGLAKCLSQSPSTGPNMLNYAIQDAVSACFLKVGCQTPKYNSWTFSHFPTALYNLGENWLSKWYQLPVSKRQCVHRRYNKIKKTKIERCMGERVPFDDNPVVGIAEEEKVRTLKSDVANVNMAVQICRPKSTSICVSQGLELEKDPKKCHSFQHCTNQTLTNPCKNDFPAQHARYCRCRKLAYSGKEASMNFISFTGDLGLAGFNKFLPTQPGSSNGLFGKPLPSLLNKAGSGSTNLLGGNLPSLPGGNPLGTIGTLPKLGGGGVPGLGSIGTATNRKWLGRGGSALSIISSLGSAASGSAGLKPISGVPKTPNVSTNPKSNIPAPAPSNPPPTVVPPPELDPVTTEEILSECQISPDIFRLSYDNPWIQSYCGCYDQLWAFGCFSLCAWKKQTQTDITNFVSIFRDQIQPLDQSRFCSDCSVTFGP